MAFKISKIQLTERDILAAELRNKGAALNSAVVGFNQAIEPLSRAVGEALDAYNAILERAPHARGRRGNPPVSPLRRTPDFALSAARWEEFCLWRRTMRTAAGGIGRRSCCPPRLLSAAAGTGG
jgi:hypothetical protein